MKNDQREEKQHEVIDNMLSAEEIRRALFNLSNAQLADLMRLHVWGKLPLYSPDSELIEEVIDRLEKNKKETDE